MTVGGTSRPEGGMRQRRYRIEPTTSPSEWALFACRISSIELEQRRMTVGASAAAKLISISRPSMASAASGTAGGGLFSPAANVGVRFETVSPFGAAMPRGECVPLREPPPGLLGEIPGSETGVQAGLATGHLVDPFSWEPKTQGQPDGTHGLVRARKPGARRGIGQ